MLNYLAIQSNTDYRDWFTIDWVLMSYKSWRITRQTDEVLPVKVSVGKTLERLPVFLKCKPVKINIPNSVAIKRKVLLSNANIFMVRVSNRRNADSPTQLSNLITPWRHNMVAIHNSVNFPRTSTLFVQSSVVFVLYTHSSTRLTWEENKLHGRTKWRPLVEWLCKFLLED